MNERIKQLVDQCWEEDGIGPSYFNPEKFAKLIYEDIITVVAAQALLNESALDVFNNLKRIYEEVEL